MAPVSLPEAEEELAQLELQLLEEEFDTPEVCKVDDNQAYGYVTHGPCRANLCEKHYKFSREYLDRAVQSGVQLQCLLCYENYLDPTAFQLIKL